MSIFAFPPFFILNFSRQAILNDSFFFEGGGGARQLHPPLAHTFGRAVSLMDSGETFFSSCFYLGWNIVVIAASWAIEVSKSFHRHVKFQKFVSLSLAKDVERAKRPLPLAADGPSIHPSAQQQHQQLLISTYFCNEEHFQRLLVTLAQRNPKGEED